MTSPILHPHVTVTLDGVADPVRVQGGSVTLAGTAIPYATAEVVLPLTADTVLGALDPRDDTRVVVNGTANGHWELVAGAGYGHGPYGHEPYGH
jgi:hypothetical protein